MFIGRKAETEQLENLYSSVTYEAAVLYGRQGIGKTELALSFADGKKAFYFCARELSEREQILEILEETGNVSSGRGLSFDFYTALKSVVEKNEGEKTVIMIDEFQYMAKAGEAFAEGLITLMGDDKVQEHFMLILLSSSINWVENSMVSEMGSLTRRLSSIIKLKEFSFSETVDMFPGANMEFSIYAWAVFGGVPGLLKLWNVKKDLRENITDLFLRKSSPLYSEAPKMLKSELRELSAYNAILTAMATGNCKLNDIYERTGFSRAKISVYIKNLIELDVAEKVFSLETGDHENVKKGIYSIKDGYLRFWYRYVFRYQSLIEQGKGDRVYFEKILTSFDSFMRERFASVCLEYLKIMSDINRLDHSYDTWGKWNGKTGTIDVVAKDEDDNVLTAFCDFGDMPVQMKKLDEFRELKRLAGIKNSEMFIFAKSGFSLELKSGAKKDNIRLINMDEL